MSSEKLGEAFNILGLDLSVSKREVRDRYRKLVKKWHPDISNKKDSCKIKDINLAYETIMKQGFNVADPWKEYQTWWSKQFGKNDIFFGNPSAEEYFKDSKYPGVKNNSANIKLTDQRKDIIDEFLYKDNVFAVIGVSKNPKKYGAIIARSILKFLMMLQVNAMEMVERKA
jgi:DnaJ-class molecular chaperone